MTAMDNLRSTVLRELYGKGKPAKRVLTALDQARATVEQLAEKVAASSPNLTDHSIDHLDSLWGYVARLLPEDRVLNPAEAFVLGGAILLHDLAMSPEAYPGGFPGAAREANYRDTVAATFRSRFGRAPMADDLDSCDPDVEAAAKETFLRRHHAEVAAELATSAFTGSARAGEGPIWIFEDELLRKSYGKVIGRVASSHWWSHDQIEREFGRQPLVGAPEKLFPAGGKKQWDINLLEMACLLRCADAAHLDGRRADRFRRHLQQPDSSSAVHWDFQERITSVDLHDDRLTYRSGGGFDYDHAAAWWFGYRMLRDVVDVELRACDDLLRSHSIARFRARGVYGIESPGRFAEVCEPIGWKPIDAEIRVADTRRLLNLLGGRQLYGDKPQVALRELVQNSSDATRARRLLDPTLPVGEVTIKIDVGPKDADDAASAHIEVMDNGVGMSERTVTNRLLVLGGSLWNSEAILDELPGLVVSDFEPTGRFGIGFFSVSMVANEVRVTTRHLHAGSAGTLVVEMGPQLAGTPILRDAAPTERRPGPGTSVRLALSQSDLWRVLGVRSARRDVPDVETIASTLRAAFPMLDCRLVLAVGDETLTLVEPEDWRTISAQQMYERVAFSSDGGEHGAKATSWVDSLVTVTDDAGRPIARFGLLAPGHERLYGGTVLRTAGGIFADSVDGEPLFGLMRGGSVALARDSAERNLTNEEARQVATWLREFIDSADVDDDVKAAAEGARRSIDPGNFDDLRLLSPTDGFVPLGEVACSELDEIVIADLRLESDLLPTRLRSGDLCLEFDDDDDDDDEDEDGEPADWVPPAFATTFFASYGAPSRLVGRGGGWPDERDVHMRILRPRIADIVADRESAVRLLSYFDPLTALESVLAVVEESSPLAMTVGSSLGAADGGLNLSFLLDALRIWRLPVAERTEMHSMMLDLNRRFDDLRDEFLEEAASRVDSVAGDLLRSPDMSREVGVHALAHLCTFFGRPYRESMSIRDPSGGRKSALGRATLYRQGLLASALGDLLQRLQEADEQ